jgi:hypothetical protein
MFYLLSETKTETKGSMVNSISHLISDVSPRKSATPVETPSNGFQTSSDIAMVNVLETIINGTNEKQTKTRANKAGSDMELTTPTPIETSSFQARSDIAMGNVLDEVIKLNQFDRKERSLAEASNPSSTTVSHDTQDTRNSDMCRFGKWVIFVFDVLDLLLMLALLTLMLLKIILRIPDTNLMYDVC